MFWLILISCAPSEDPSPEEVQRALVAAEERIVVLENEVEGYRRRMASIERLDAAMESAHTLVEARCMEGGTSPGDYRMATPGWDELREDPGGVLAQGRWIPHGDPGDPTGWRLVRMARGGLLDSCGLRSADVLVRVNGVSMVLPDGPQEAVEAASTASVVQLELLRNRKPVALNIHRVDH